METIITARVKLQYLSEDDAPFIMELLNSPEWIANIGQRNINSIEDAVAYIKGIQTMQNALVWTISYAEEPIGIITLLKKPYLPAPDLGFALLTKYAGKGLAFEAADAVLKEAMKTNNTLCAVTVASNLRSQKLLVKLGFKDDGTIENNGEKLSLYTYSP